jgi:hypothetical protein
VGGNETECKVRTLAYEHALKLLPERAPLRTYFDALQLEMLCGTPPPARALHAHPDAAVEGSEEGFPPAHDSSTADGGSGLHVDATAGSDETGDGSQQQPFMTLVKALRTARATKAAASSSKHTAPPAIILHAGVHFLNDTLVLGAEDSGQVIRNLPGAEAWISGGVPVIAPQWKLHKKSIYVAQLPSEITAVPALYTVTPHQRLVRARYPNGNWEIDQWGWCRPVPVHDMPRQCGHGPGALLPAVWRAELADRCECDPWRSLRLGGPVVAGFEEGQTEAAHWSTWQLLFTWQLHSLLLYDGAGRAVRAVGQL